MRHIRDLLKSVDSADAYAGIDCNSVSFLNIITAGDILGMFCSTGMVSIVHLSVYLLVFLCPHIERLGMCCFTVDH